MGATEGISRSNAMIIVRSSAPLPPRAAIMQVGRNEPERHGIQTCNLHSWGETSIIRQISDFVCSARASLLSLVDLGCSACSILPPSTDSCASLLA